MSPASSLHALALAALVALSAGLKAHDFRKCGDTPFCALHRAAPAPPWTLNASSLAYDESRLTVQLLPSSTAPPEARSLPTVLALCVLPSGAVHVAIDDDPRLPPDSLSQPDPAVVKPEAWDDEMDGEWDAPMIKLGRAVKQRFRAEQSLASTASVTPSDRCEHRRQTSLDRLVCTLDGGTSVEVELRHSPMIITVLRDGARVARLNGRALLRFEPFVQSVASDAAVSSLPESHKFNGFTMPLAYGSSSVGLDIDFPLATHAYGLPERTVSHALPPTVGREPYRLFNLDVFEYELDHPMGVYGSVPFL